MVDSVVPFFLFFLFPFQECSKSSFEIMVRGGFGKARGRG